MPYRQEHTKLVAEFLANGGVINKVPPPEPTAANDVLRYLQARNVDVHAVVEPGEAVSKYMYKSRIISLKELVTIANRHRSRRRLPPLSCHH